MTLLERIAKAQNERICVLCGTKESLHDHRAQRHAFRAESVARFPARDLTGWSKAA